MKNPNSLIINATRHWLEQTVIGFNFCPFAKREYERNTIRYRVIESSKTEGQLQALLDELKHLDSNTETETTLMILPNGLADFITYLERLELANRLLLAEGYEGVYQIASFHPDYYFDGTEIDDAANYTNRSPFPIFHLLRESSLERVLAKYPNPENIPLRNIQKATELGIEVFQSILREALQSKH